MGDIITAVYRDGALYPLQPLNLRESETVRIQVLWAFK
jgi:predicted DNA-binding antitoxin AbrB/MazE fold protein